ncbi:MAG: AAA family ATPase, partial [Caedimonadaceae bacterium]
MAIQFARLEYVSRSTGGNACRKAAYNERTSLKCERTGELFYFEHKEDGIYHDVMLPEGAHEKFKSSKVLWNAVEHFERRSNSQLCKELVLALPDNPEISFEDRIELTRQFVEQNFVSKGVAVQMDIHAPHEGDKNWHAHLLVTTRRFSKDGMTFHTHKARDLDPEVRGGMIVEADLWGEIWRDLQNTYFKEKGLDLRVDAIGLVPQEHLGPVRMRHHMNDALQRAELIKESNEALCQDPEVILESLSQNKAVISKRDIERFIEKHVPKERQESIHQAIFEHKSLIPLLDPESGKETDLFTLKQTRKNEEKLLRFATSLHQQKGLSIEDNLRQEIKDLYQLTSEQEAAFEHATQYHNLSIIQGRAGVGKSYVLQPIREVHESSGYRVIGLAPTNKVAEDLKEDGFVHATTCHAFLFALKNQRQQIDDKTLLVVDEAAMLSTDLQIELLHAAKKTGAKVLLVGDSRQLPSIQRGGMFEVLAERFGASEITEVRRQSIEWQREVSECLSRGEVLPALQILDEHERIIFSPTKEESLSKLINAWAKDVREDSSDTKLILAQRNVDVDTLNLAARDIMRSSGKLGDKDYAIMTKRGVTYFAEGDRIQLTETDKSQNLFNGNFGIITKLSETSCTILQDNGEEVTFNPETYIGLRHGYAGTIYKAQGSTLPKTYILHDRSTTLNNSYVSLTRQTEDLKVFASHTETKSLQHMAQQIGRHHGKEASLKYLTLKDLERQEREGKETLIQKMSDTARDVTTKVKDHFHKNDAFYQIQERDALQPQKVETKDPVFQMEGKTFGEISNTLERRLYVMFEEKHKRMLLQEERVFLQNQATRTAEYLHSMREQNQKDPTYDDVKVLSIRARFELDRESEISENFLKKLEKQDDFEPGDHLYAKLYGERLSKIEGRRFEEHFRQHGDQPHLRTLAKEASKELQQNLKMQKTMVQELKATHKIDISIATRLSQEIMRFKEQYGFDPSVREVENLTKISIYVENRQTAYEEKYKNLDSDLKEQSINLARRREIKGISSFMRHYARFPNQGEIKDIQKVIQKDIKEIDLNLEKTKA